MDAGGRLRPGPGRCRGSGAGESARRIDAAAVSRAEHDLPRTAQQADSLRFQQKRLKLKRQK